MSASCRPTWAISDTGRKAEIETSTSSGSIGGGDPALQHQRRAQRGDGQAAQAGGDLQPGGLRRQVRQQAQPLRLVALAQLP